MALQRHKLMQPLQGCRISPDVAQMRAVLSLAGQDGVAVAAPKRRIGQAAFQVGRAWLYDFCRLTPFPAGQGAKNPKLGHRLVTPVCPDRSALPGNRGTQC
jgi:hypothetical protein